MIEGFCTGSGAKDRYIVAFSKIVHRNSREKIPPFEKGSWPTFDWEKWTTNPLAVVGTLRGSEEIIWECQRRNHEFYYMDHAYFHATRDYRPGQYGQLYRVVKNQMQLNKLVELTNADKKRIEKYKPITFNSWKFGTYILICPPTKAICRLYNIDEQGWLDKVITQLRKYTDRQIIVRKKDSKTSLLEQLKSCHAMVTMQSTAAIEAVMNGVPVFCDKVSQANAIGENDLSKIEKPYYADRDIIEKWIDSLLSCQFTMEEIKNGIAHEVVKRLQ